MTEKRSCISEDFANGIMKSTTVQEKTLSRISEKIIYKEKKTMASFNKVILIGNLTADPELKQTTSGVSVCRFSIGVARKLAKDVSDFFSIVAWRQSGEFVARYFKKGMPILVLGNLQNRSYDKNGQKVYVTEVIADEITFVEKKNDDPYVSNTAPSAPVAPPKFEEVENDESLPF